MSDDPRYLENQRWWAEDHPRVWPIFALLGALIILLPVFLWVTW